MVEEYPTQTPGKDAFIDIIKEEGEFLVFSPYYPTGEVGNSPWGKNPSSILKRMTNRRINGNYLLIK